MTLDLRNVTKTVGGEAQIRDVSLTLQRGTLNVLLGPTLSGKTSLMRLMAGLDRPTSGKVFWDGTDVTGVPVRQRSVAMVHQQFINYLTLSVYENIASPLRVAGRSKTEIDRRVNPQAPSDCALKRLDHVWEDGGAYALLGPSGCGKTTLLSIVSGLITASEGRVVFDGNDVTGLPTASRNIAQVFQFPVIYDTMTVAENLAFPLWRLRPAPK